MKSFDRPAIVERPRRLRRTAATRALVQETTVTVRDLIAPLFVIEGRGNPDPVDSMPGVSRLPIDRLIRECSELAELGIRAIALFPKLDSSLKDLKGTEALNSDTLVLRAVRAIKMELPDLLVITDIALDPYTVHGHDGLLTGDNTDVDNDSTVQILSQMAVLNAEAGVDIVAPSDMMDGRIGAIRAGLDAEGFTGTAILSYCAKYASAYYGPFRDAVGSSLAAGTRLLGKQTYQMNPANRREAQREQRLDEAEGADMLMVKPAGPYLDVLSNLRQTSDLPLCAYQVSGEYAQLQAAAKLGWLDLERCRDESITGIKRAGADMIITYFAKELAQSIKERHGVL